MARKQKTEMVFHTALKDKIAFGQSKHAAKQGLGFGESTYQIYSYGTYHTYVKECKQYAKWLSDEKGVGKIKDVKDTEQYAKEYIQSRLDSGVSVWTAKMERSALGMLYGKRIEIDMPKRDNKAITRSRTSDREYTKHISRDGRHKDIFVTVGACGCRRKDIGRLTVNSFKEIDGRLYVRMEQSKGGRDRLAPVLPSAVDDVKAVIEKAKAEDREKLFESIPQRIDIHGLRREYTLNIYEAFSKDRDSRDAYLKAAGVPERHEYTTYKDKDGNTQTREVRKDTYRDRDGNVYDRDDFVRRLSGSRS